MTNGDISTSARDSRSPEHPVESPRARWWVHLGREPLLHFLLVGAALFGFSAWFQGPANGNVARVVVSAGKIEHLTAIFSRTWQRPPTKQELDGLVDDFIREEIAYREGMNLGLDRDDTIIRRRIRQKLDFFAEDLASQLEPTDEQLASFLQEHSETYRVDPQLSFRQVFFDPQRHPDGVEQEVAKVLAALNAEPSSAAQELGDRSLLEHQYPDLSRRDVASIFGEPFAAELVGLEPQRWHGPIRSAYGVHAVIVDERRLGRALELNEAREAIRRDWEHRRRKELTEEFYEGLRKKYDVTIEWPRLSNSES